MGQTPEEVIREQREKIQELEKLLGAKTAPQFDGMGDMLKEATATMKGLDLGILGRAKAMINKWVPKNTEPMTIEGHKCNVTITESGMVAIEFPDYETGITYYNLLKGA